MNLTRWYPVALLPLAAAAVGAAPDPARVAAIAAMLDPAPAGVGRPIGDRAAWSEVAKLPGLAGVVQRAEAIAATPVPAWTDAMFEEAVRTGNRALTNSGTGQRRQRIAALTLGEAIEHQGRFLPALRETIAALCAEPTWVHPAHDPKLANLRGEVVDINLTSASLAFSLATCDYILGDQLGAETRALIRERVFQRAIEPYRDMATGRREPLWWMTTTNNWNAVCHCGVVGAALTMVEDRAERAFFIASAEELIRNFLAGFTPDGYCSEGIGYYNYGYGHFLVLAETVAQATKGGLDMQRWPEALAPAMFGRRIEIADGVFPAFADCKLGNRPNERYLRFLDRKLGLAPVADVRAETAALAGELPEICVLALPNSAEATPLATGPSAAIGLRSWFNDAGILLSRPAAGAATRLAVALKGGHNDEHHNHNDVGSYVVAVGGVGVLVDPGLETYNLLTFSARRYEGKLLNSYGHPVPVVAGQLQRTGREAEGQVLAVDFTDQHDRYRLDLTRCYDVPELTTLSREWVYDRAGLGSLTVTDTVKFSSPQSFETALITIGDWRELGPDRRLIWVEDQAVDVTVDTGGAPYQWVTETIDYTDTKPNRMAIRLTQPVSEASVKVTIRPHVFEDTGGEAALVKNGDFRLGTFGWQLDAMCAVVDDPLGGGFQALKVTDESTTAGSNASSARFRLEGGRSYELRGRVHGPGQTNGLGVYVRLYNAAGEQVKPMGDDGPQTVYTTVGQTGDAWEAFSYRFTTPTDCVTANLWLHSFNGATVTCYVTDLAVAAVD